MPWVNDQYGLCSPVYRTVHIIAHTLVDLKWHTYCSISRWIKRFTCTLLLERFLHASLVEKNQRCMSVKNIIRRAPATILVELCLPVGKFCTLKKNLYRLLQQILFVIFVTFGFTLCTYSNLLHTSSLRLFLPRSLPESAYSENSGTRNVSARAHQGLDPDRTKKQLIPASA
ncbi:hypothetical protein DFS34DRAFT_640126 [Phlyctochytrium arcticum]|nr:hypothetical protein DFS34DRAFT_640126 [Phlyctochytrium arcticum]